MKIKNSIIKRKAKKTGLKENDFEKYKTKCLRISIVVALFAWLFVGVLIKNILSSGAIGIIIGTIFFIFLLRAPFVKKKKSVEEIEAELPFFLFSLVTELRTGKGFIAAIERIADKESETGKEFQKLLNDVKKGSSIQDGLERMSQRIGSRQVRRALGNISSMHLQGSNNFSGLKKIAQELIARQRINSREFSSKMVMYSLVFIAASAIVPAMFLSFILVGSYFMKISFTPIQILLITTIIFPVIDLGILGMINSKTPVFLKR